MSTTIDAMTTNVYPCPEPASGGRVAEEPRWKEAEKARLALAESRRRALRTRSQGFDD
jgi:hypothetical protein